MRISTFYKILFACLIANVSIFSNQLKAGSITLPAESGSIKFSDPIVASNMSLVVETNQSAEAYTEVVTIDGVQCRKIPAGKFMYVSCSRSAVPTSQANILVAITYYANSNNALWFNYNSNTNNYSIADFGKTKSNQWVTTIVAITDGAFNGLMNGGSDFRLGFNNEDNYIREIFIYNSALNPDAQTIPAKPNNRNSEFKEKSFAGYQIWHKAGPKASDWVHWAYGKIPAAGYLVNENIASFPDLSEYPDSVLFATNFANLGNGRATGLYHDPSLNIINRQMGWLQMYGLDGVAVQRFVGGIGKSVTISAESHLSNVKTACEATGRLFYICYDLNGSDATIVDRIKVDWVYEIEQIRALTSSPNYATVDGKPVVEIWGIGMDMATVDQNAGIINFLKSRGCYVIGGTKREWRTDPKGYADVYKSLNSISPWTVGAYNTISGANNYLSTMQPDKSYCDQYGIDYFPVVFPGSGNWLSADGTFSQTDRAGGMLLWTQALNAKSIGLKSVYYAMLDEFEEGTNLINGAVDYFDIPTDQYFETFAKDGVWTSSNYYLRLGATAAKMLRGDIPVTSTIPIPYSLGPIYYRNSFESRSTTFSMNGATTSQTLKIDPCFYNPALSSSSGVTSPLVSIVKESGLTKSGLYSTKITGTANSASDAKFYYKIADIRIAVKANMQLSFWKYTANELGKYASVDLLFKSGKILHNLASYTDNNGNAMHPNIARGTIGTWSKFTCQIGKGELVEDELTGIIIAYDHPSASGSFTAYFDDIIVEDSTDSSLPLAIKINKTEQPSFKIYPNPAHFNIIIDYQMTKVSDISIVIYNLQGSMIKSVKQSSLAGSHSLDIDISDLESGIYFVRFTSNGFLKTEKMIVR